MTLRHVDQIGTYHKADHFTIDRTIDAELRQHDTHYTGKHDAPKTVLLTLSNCTEIAVSVEDGRIIGHDAAHRHYLYFAAKLHDTDSPAWFLRSDMIQVGNRVIVGSDHPQPRAADHYPTVKLITVYDND